MESIFIPVSPGIIVATPQHEKKIPYNWHNRLNRKFRLVEIEKGT